MNRLRSRRVSIILLFVMLFSLFATSVQARQSDDATVEIFRINRLYVIIKITFPTELSGEFAATLAGKHFDCLLTSSTTLLCIGPMRYGPEYATLTVYDQDTKENILEKSVKSPPTNGIGEKDPTQAPAQETPETPVKPVKTPETPNPCDGPCD